ncbi:hypothetical protein MKK58_19390 [Methylobacterium sp. J-078]|uniref:hypothetical protein n=1 Tax=Methylobacterium sp. J-078 TaxID=2836657 RepID=UPI001FBA9698|nr:hypothetical protein [Methylobacterium sp. J-078]MCJ2046684.1 hypothetical protein [Methylobacterium sp. J-078]
MILTHAFGAALRLVALLSFLAVPARAAEPIFPPAGAVGLVPPPGMAPAKAFAGFEHRSGASIVIVEMPAEAYGQLVTGFTPEALSATGFRAKGGSEGLPVAGGEGRVLRGSQAANGLTYAKWVAVVRGAGGTGLVTVQVPESARRQVPDRAVEAALATIAFRAPGSVDDQIATLPYTVGDRAGFRPVRTLMGNALLLTDGPRDVDPEGTQALVIVAPALGQVPVAPGQEGAFARKALGTIREVRDVVVTDEERSTRDGAVVVHLRGTGKDARSGREVGVIQTIRFADGGYLRVVGLAGADRPEVLARVERIAASVAPRLGRGPAP